MGVPSAQHRGWHRQAREALAEQMSELTSQIPQLYQWVWCWGGGRSMGGNE